MGKLNRAIPKQAFLFVSSTGQRSALYTQLKAEKCLFCALKKHYLHYSSFLKALFTPGNFYSFTIQQFSKGYHSAINYSLELCSIIHSAALTLPILNQVNIFHDSFYPLKIIGQQYQISPILKSLSVLSQICHNRGAPL